MTNKYEDAINFYIKNNEYSIAKVAKKFGVDRLRLGELLRNSGMDTNARRRKFSLNESYFETIDSEEKAYWLGFILADGCLKGHQFCLCLSECDKYILEEFNKCIEYSGGVKTGTTKLNDKTFKNASVTISRAGFLKSLNKCGIYANKSHNAKFDENNVIPTKYLNAYIRGIFDGDGSFTYGDYNHSCEISFCGTYDVCLGIKSVIENELGIDLKIHSIRNIYRLRICKKEAVKKVFEFMYKDASYFLERKYNKLMNYCRLI